MPPTTVKIFSATVTVASVSDDDFSIIRISMMIMINAMRPTHTTAPRRLKTDVTAGGLFDTL